MHRAEMPVIEPPVIRLREGEIDRLPPDRIIGADKAPCGRERQRKIVGVVVKVVIPRAVGRIGVNLLPLMLGSERPLDRFAQFRQRASSTSSAIPSVLSLLSVCHIRIWLDR